MTLNLDSAHFNMLEQQVRPSDVLDDRVLEAMRKIPRDLFVDDSLRGLAYADTELPIGDGQYMLSPVLQGRMLQALAVHPDEQVLEIGTGSGYFTALLAQLAKQIISVEINPIFSEQAAQRLQKLNINNINLQVGDASQGWSLQDRIDVIVTTAAFVEVPDSYLQSLKVGGRMLAIVGDAPVMSVQLIRRESEWQWHTETLMETLVPPMINAEPKAQFQF